MGLEWVNEPKTPAQHYEDHLNGRVYKAMLNAIFYCVVAWLGAALGLFVVAWLISLLP